MKIEAIFGGILSLFVLGVAAFALMSNWGRGSSGGSAGGVVVASGEADVSVCQCFDRGFSMAAQFSVLDPEYGTHFVLCREQLGQKGGDAFTAGWNARTNAEPWGASCKAYLRRKDV